MTTLNQIWQIITKEKRVIVSSLLFSTFLAGCASSEKPTPQMTMKEAHSRHQDYLYGGRIDEVRSSWEKLNKIDDERYSFSSDLRLPNPELEIYIFSQRSSDGSISQGYNKKFSMYEKVHYKKGE